MHEAGGGRSGQPEHGLRVVRGIASGARQNSIVVASGANHSLKANEVAGLRSAFQGASYALFQLETPLDAVGAALRLAKEEGARTMLDPAPAQPLSREITSMVDFLTPNETEACVLVGRPPGRVTMSDAPALAFTLRELTGAGAVVLKLGEQGCLWWDGTMGFTSPGLPVQAVDTTAAGDTFNGALAVALAEGKRAEDALRWANAAAALSVQKTGAQASIPLRAAVDSFLVSRR
ncbi:MAG: bifunctional hydroxymethylpyrimidine kinase/phosphomethylpyrimidine kinase [Candidatus Solibacter usitatus]|nr:bifunctional hydroxymethylpyrimidine kinase/phosphomethylpyrimidine kinase [Candidatus Solibacter usitatus]